MSKSKQLIKSVKDHLDYTNKIQTEVSDLEYTKAMSHMPMLEMLDSLKTGIIIVQDYHKHNFFFLSKKFDSHFGFHKNHIENTSQEWFRERLNPEDYFVNDLGIRARKYMQDQPVEERKDYKIIAEFRLLNDKNKWVHITMQDYVLELDKKGNIWLVLKVLDFSPKQDIDATGSAVLQNSVTGEVIFTTEKESNYNISNREKEVLGLIAKGLKSKEISEKLFISKNTVNNHRRNIIDKLKVSNTQEAVSNAKEFGII